MNNLIYTLLIICSVFTSNFVKAELDSPYMLKLKVEERIQTKSEAILSKVLREKDYSLNVTAKVKQTGAKTQLNESPSFVPYKAEKQFSETEKVLLSKIGLWSDLPKVNATTTEAKLSIEKVTIRVGIQEWFSDENLKSLETMLKESIAQESFPVDLKVKPFKSFVKESLEREKAEQKKEQEEVNRQLASEPQKNISDFLEKFSIELTVLFCVFLIMIIGVFVIKGLANRWERVQDDHVSAMKSTHVSANNTTIAGPGGNEEAGGDGLGNSTLSFENGLEATLVSENQSGTLKESKKAFLSFYSDNPVAANELLHKWIHENNEDAKAGLYGLLSQLSMDELGNITSQLKETDKSSLVEVLSLQATKDLVEKGAHFLKKEIIVEKLNLKTNIDKNIANFLNTLTKDEINAAVQKSVRFGAFLFNFLKPLQVISFTKELDSETMQDIVNATIEEDLENITQEAEALVSFVQNYRVNNNIEHKPFVANAEVYIKELGPNKESKIFESIIASGDRKLLMEVADKYFPADLIEKIPESALAEFMNSMPLAQRASMLFGFEEERRTKFLSCYQSNANLLDLINVELSLIEKNAERKAEVLDQKDKLWEDFVTNFRATLSKNVALRKSIQPILEDWASENMGVQDEHVASAG
ncbi:MAG: hypothetical protein VX642_01870 [Bdellovibrionota bacterium]|nr:hypothetical protein [Bdellovibrionota bacterium]